MAPERFRDSRRARSPNICDCQGGPGPLNITPDLPVMCSRRGPADRGPPVLCPATRTTPLALRAGGASITRGFVLSPLWSSADEDSIGGRASHPATKIFTRRSVRSACHSARSTSAGLSRAVVRPGQNATAFAATSTAGMVSRTSGTGVMAIVEMPSPLANSAQAQWPAATPKGTPRHARPRFPRRSWGRPPRRGR